MCLFWLHTQSFTSIKAYDFWDTVMRIQKGILYTGRDIMFANQPDAHTNHYFGRYVFVHTTIYCLYPLMSVNVPVSVGIIIIIHETSAIRKNANWHGSSSTTSGSVLGISSPTHSIFRSIPSHRVLCPSLLWVASIQTSTIGSLSPRIK